MKESPVHPKPVQRPNSAGEGTLPFIVHPTDPGLFRNRALNL